MNGPTLCTYLMVNNMANILNGYDMFKAILFSTIHGIIMTIKRQFIVYS